MEKREPSYIVGGDVSGWSYCGKQYWGSLKTKNRVTIWPSQLTPGRVSRRNYNSKTFTQSYVHRSTVHNSQDVGTSRMPVDRGMDKKMWSIDHGVLVGRKEGWDTATCGNVRTWPADHHTKCSKSDRDKYHTTSCACRIWKIIQWNYSQNRHRLTEVENNLW